MGLLDGDKTIMAAAIDAQRDGVQHQGAGLRG